MNALVVVDVQNDFLPGGALAVPGGDAILPVLNALLPRFDHVVATQDWHPPDHGSFAASHPGKQPGDRILLGGMPQVLWPIHCVQGTRGAELAAALDRTRIEAVIAKGTERDIDSYSGFFDNGHRRATGLAHWLRERDVDDLSIAGLATDYCVKFTVLDACGLGFRVTVLADACRGIEQNPGDIAAAWVAMRRAGAIVSGSIALAAPPHPSLPGE